MGLWHIDASPSTPKRLALIDMRKIGPILGFYSTLHIGFDQWEVYTLFSGFSHRLAKCQHGQHDHHVELVQSAPGRPSWSLEGCNASCQEASGGYTETGVIRPAD